jgi:ribosomal-protein-alanine N-acetyltransferase
LEVRPSNKKAIALYLKKGFEKIGERPSYYKHSDGRENAEIFLLNTKKIGYFDEDQYWS